jgi:hypothetical protein
MTHEVGSLTRDGVAASVAAARNALSAHGDRP